MEFLADGLLISGALAAALYCLILARRLNALKRLDSGLGGAIAGLSERIELTRASLAETKSSTGDITRELASLTARAEIAAGRLELLLATVHEGEGKGTGKTSREPLKLKPRIEEAEVPQAPRQRAEPERPERQTLSALRRLASDGG